MEIHHPENPIHSKKEFLFHMFTVVLGILIALGMEGIVEWAHHRALVREARENITTELRKNKETVDEAITELHHREADLNKIIDLMHRGEKDPAVFKGQTLNFRIELHDLYSTAWQTATTSSAVTYMKYEELTSYTDVYLTQQTFTSMQEQALNGMIMIGSLMEVTMKDPISRRCQRRSFRRSHRKPIKI